LFIDKSCIRETAYQCIIVTAVPGTSIYKPNLLIDIVEIT